MGRTLFVIFIGLLGAGILCGLGYWQLQRLEWKKTVLAEIETQISADPIALPDDPGPDAHKYLPVTVAGEFGQGEIHVYVSVKGIGPGYRIIAPFETGDRTILIDRGFVPIGLMEQPRASGEAEIVGNLHWPDEVDSFTPDPDLANSIWFARDVPSMSERLGTEPVLIIAATKTDRNISPIPVDTAGVPNDHLQYAITWFLLAIAWLGMTVYFLRRSRTAPPPFPQGRYR